MRKPNVLDDTVNCVDYDGYTHAVITANVINIINDIIDDIKKLKEEWAEYDKKFAAWVESINVHERAIDKLQMALEPEKCEVKDPAEYYPIDYVGCRPNMATISEIKKEDPYAEQRKWIGCLVRYKICDSQGGWYTDVLDEIVDHPIYPFKMRNGQTAQVCEVVKPNEIYPNKARTW